MSDLGNLLSLVPLLNGGLNTTAIVNNIDTANQVNTRRSWVVGAISGIFGTIFGILSLGALIGIAVGIGSFIVGGLLTYGFGKLQNWVTFGSQKHKHNHQHGKNENQHKNEIEKLPEMTKGVKEFEKVIFGVFLKFSDCLTPSAVKIFLKEYFQNLKTTEIDEFMQNMQSRVKDKNSLFFIETAAKDKNLLHRKLSSKNPDELKKYLEDSSNFNQISTSFSPSDFASFVKSHSDFPTELMLKYEQGILVINACKRNLQEERSKGPQSVASQTEPEPNTHQENLLQAQNNLMAQILQNMSNQQQIPPQGNNYGQNNIPQMFNNYGPNNPQTFPAPQGNNYEQNNIPKMFNNYGPNNPINQGANLNLSPYNPNTLDPNGSFGLRNALPNGVRPGENPKEVYLKNNVVSKSDQDENPFFKKSETNPTDQKQQKPVITISLPEKKTPENNTETTHQEEEKKI